MKKKIILTILILSSLLGLTSSATAAIISSYNLPTSQQVNDLAKVLSPAEKVFLLAQINTVHDKYGQQISILIIPTLSGETVDEYAFKAAAKLGMDLAENKSLLILVALKEKKIRMEIGGGDKSLLSAAAAQNIIDQKISPLFASKEYASGLGYGIANLSNIFEADKKMQSKTEIKHSAPSLKDMVSGGAAMVISMFLVAIAFQVMAVRLRKGEVLYKSGKKL